MVKIIYDDKMKALITYKIIFFQFYGNTYDSYDDKNFADDHRYENIDEQDDDD